MPGPFVELVFNHVQHGVYIMTGVFFRVMEKTYNLLFPCSAGTAHLQQVRAEVVVSSLVHLR